jgi:hypothetical protein
MPRTPTDLAGLIVTIHLAALADNGWRAIGDDLCRKLCVGSDALVKQSAIANIKPGAHFSASIPLTLGHMRIIGKLQHYLV